MHIQYCSDLHLEFPSNRAFLEHNPIEKKGDMLIVAGDFFYLNSPLHPIENILSHLEQQFDQTIIIPGNHEFYDGYDLELALRNDWKKTISGHPTISWTNNLTIYPQDNLRIILTSLWSDCQLNESEKGQLNDFNHSIYRGEELSVHRYRKNHQECLQYLQNEISTSFEGFTVVVTHHLPAYQLLPDAGQYRELATCYASDLEEFILKYQPSYWICGHSHYNKAPMQIGDTQIVSNPLGYRGIQDDITFDPAAIISIPEK